MDFFEEFLSDKCNIPLLKSRANVNLIKTYMV